MKTKNIAIVQGHPDRDQKHYCHALANAYAEGATAKGHAIKFLDAASITVPFLQNQLEFNNQDLDPKIETIQTAIRWADHLLIVYPLWLGTMPAVLKHFFEQVFRPNFAFAKSENNKWPKKLLQGKSAHIVVTMGMPAWLYRWFYHAHSVKSLERNILNFSGIAPVQHSFIGQIDSANDSIRLKWLRKMKQMGAVCA